MSTDTAEAATFVPITKQVGGGLTITVQGDKPLFILGRNGTGKSALVQSLVGVLGTSVVYLPGSRPSYFDQEFFSMTPATRKQYDAQSAHWDRSPDIRWHAMYGTQRNEKAVHDLQAREAQYNVDAIDEIKRDGVHSKAIARLQAANSPLDQVNALLEIASLPITLLMQDGLKAKRGNDVFSIAKMSDGERIATILAAEVVSAPAQTVFLIDEPELHLHRAIVIPLLAALISKRPDCGFVVSTHELELPRALQKGTLLLVRNVTWAGGAARSWDVDTLTSVEEIPESLYIDILGSRQRMLFVEGTDGNLDAAIYPMLFDEVSVSSRGSCRQVAEAVTGIRAINEMHRVEALGLVDNDAMSEQQVADLEAKGIYPMSVYSVESLYYSKDVIDAVAQAQAQVQRCDAAGIVADATAAALKVLEDESVLNHLAARLAERAVHDCALRALPRRGDLPKMEGEVIRIEIRSPHGAELARLKDFVAADSLHEIVARYPVRESPILDVIAKGLRFRRREDYEAAALTCVAGSAALKQVLRTKLGKLADHLTRPATDDASRI